MGSGLLALWGSLGWEASSERSKGTLGDGSVLATDRMIWGRSRVVSKGAACGGRPGGTRSLRPQSRGGPLALGVLWGIGRTRYSDTTFGEPGGTLSLRHLAGDKTPGKGPFSPGGSVIPHPSF